MRNLDRVAIDCSERFNVFVGPNGAGKTAILESIHILARGRSFRSAAIGPVVRHGEAVLVVRGQLNDERRGKVTVRVSKDRQDRGSAALNGERVRRISDIAQVFPVQLILPDVAKIVLGSPSERRRFVDSGAFHVKRGYLEDALAYQRALQQRNALLRSFGSRRASAADELGVWTRRLKDLAEPIDVARSAYVEALSEVTLDRLYELAPDLGACLQYQRGWPAGKALQDCLRESLERDVRFGATQFGPHRCDVLLLVKGGKAVDTLSRGQAKILAIALHLAQAELTRRVGGRSSVFLIDDLGSELDRSSNERFLALLQSTKCQVFATTTAKVDDEQASPGRLFHVERGVCQPIRDVGVMNV